MIHHATADLRKRYADDPIVLDILSAYELGQQAFEQMRGACDTAQRELGVVTQERDALAAWKCDTCGARFSEYVKPESLGGVKHCSTCVALAVAQKNLDAEREKRKVLARELSKGLDGMNDRRLAAVERAVQAQADLAALTAANDALEREAAGLRETVERIDQWAHAYPVKQFPEQDLKAIGALLEANGYSMGALHGSWGRDILKGIGEMTRAALAAQEGR